MPILSQVNTWMNVAMLKGVLKGQYTLQSQGHSCLTYGIAVCKPTLIPHHYHYKLVLNSFQVLVPSGLYKQNKNLSFVNFLSWLPTDLIRKAI